MRRDARSTALPPEETLSDLEDREAALVEALDAGSYPDDLLRLLFVCCHPSCRPTSRSRWR